MSVFGTQEIVAISGTILFNSAAQILLRTGLRDADIAGMVSERAVGQLGSTILHPAVLGGIGSFAIGLLFWFLAISRLPASVAYPMISVGYIVVVVLSSTLLHEEIGWQKLAGASAIVFGVALIAKSA